MTTCLGKSCSFGLPRMPFVNCCQFMYLVIPFWFWRAGCGILIIAFAGRMWDPDHCLSFYFESLIWAAHCSFHHWPKTLDSVQCPWPATTDLTSDKWPLIMTLDPWPATSDQWPMKIVWPVTPDRRPLILDQSPLIMTLDHGLDPWLTHDLWQWPLPLTDPCLWPLAHDLDPLKIVWPVTHDHWPVTPDQRTFTSDQWPLIMTLDQWPLTPWFLAIYYSIFGYPFIIRFLITHN